MRSCGICGCTDALACPGGCYWVAEDLCSGCANNDASDESPLAIGDGCSNAGGHRPLWLNSSRGYCVHCREPLMCEAVNA
jgi:hypothetical protein